MTMTSFLRRLLLALAPIALESAAAAAARAIEKARRPKA
jgi:hypothetical protein